MIKNFIEVIDEVKALEEKIQPLQNELSDKRKTLSELNEQLKFNNSLKDFLSKKILDTYTDSELEEVGKYRKLIHPNPYIPTEVTFYANSSVFDPFNDEWYIYDYERNGEKIRFSVSCKKNEGSISGLMTFLDVHHTDWFNINEYENGKG